MAAPNAWEAVKRSGDAAIERWITAELDGRTCLIALVGSQTAERKWVRHEISQAWNENRGVLGIRIHKLLDSSGNSSVAGANPFDHVTFRSGGALSSVAPLKNPSGTDSKSVYASIAANIGDWIEEAIQVRKNHR